MKLYIININALIFSIVSILKIIKINIEYLTFNKKDLSENSKNLIIYKMHDWENFFNE